jgi:hypothetical protein
MDPYLEGPMWDDFHTSFIPLCKQAINRALPKPYRARIDAKINLVEVNTDEIKLIKPDVAVIRSPLAGDHSARPSSTATIEPVLLTLPLFEEVKEYRIEIIHNPDGALVAVLELLSPRNKAAGAGSLEYNLKRNAVIRQAVHLIEIDLLLGGRRLPMQEALPPADYYALVSRSDRRPKSDVYGWTLRDPLPRIPIPLLPGEPDISLDLAAVFKQTFDSGEYAVDLDYARPPGARIPELHRQWVADLAKSATLA